MFIDLDAFRIRLQGALDTQAVALTDEELARVTEWYPRCPGKDPWDVRAYAGRAGVGAREYRVLRGTGVQDVYRSTERARAEAVRAALNALESQEVLGRGV